MTPVSERLGMYTVMPLATALFSYAMRKYSMEATEASMGKQSAARANRAPLALALFKKRYLAPLRPPHKKHLHLFFCCIVSWIIIWKSI